MRQIPIRLRVSAGFRDLGLCMFLVLSLAACEWKGLQKKGSTCVSSDSSLVRFQEIQQSLLDFGAARGLFTKDYTQTARKIEGGVHTIRVEYWPGRLSSNYNLVVRINPKYGGSGVVLNGRRGEFGKEEFSAVLQMLESKYGFRTSPPGDHGQCD